MSGITGPFDELEAIEKRLGKISTAALAKAGARAIQRVARAQYKAGVGPDGAPWEPNKDGSKPLPNAANKVTFSAEGGTIVVSAPFHYRFHATKAPVMPSNDGPLPGPWEQALVAASRDVVEGKKK